MRVRTEQLRGWMRWGNKGALALTDQVFMAGSNFLLNVILARALSAADYGGYTLAFSIFLLMANTYQAVLLVPSLVLGTTVYSARRQFYCGALLRVHALLSSVAVVLLAGGALYYSTAGGRPEVAEALGGLAVAIPCVLLFWLARSLFYLDLLPGMAAFGSVMYSIVLIACVYILMHFSMLSTFTAFAATAIASSGLAVFLLRQLQPDLSRRPGSISVGELWRESWIYGRWELAIASTFWLLTNFCYILAAGTMSAAHTGELRALQNLALPLTHAAGSALRLAVPHLCRVFEAGGVVETSRRVYQLCAGAVVVSAAYVGLTAAVSPLPIRLLYGSKFVEYAGLLPIILLTTLFWSVVESLAVGFRAMRYNQGILIAYSTAAVIYLIGGYPLAKSYGFEGVVAGLVLSHAAAALMALVVYKRAVQREMQREATAVAAYAA